MTTRLLTLITLTAALGACTGIPERNANLDQTRERLSSAQSDTQVATMASEELRQAGDAVAQAEKAWSSNQPKSTVDHLAYVADQRVMIARETASGKSAEAVTAGAAAERNKNILTSRTNEADQARQQLALSEQENARKTNELAQADAAAKLDQSRVDSSEARAKALELQLQELNAKKTDRGYVLTLGNVMFDSGQAKLMPEGAGYMARVADAFKSNPMLRGSIQGYTDSVGNSASNYRLSDWRARAVMTALVSLGVNPAQLSTQGFGEANPVGDNATPAGRQMNRRVEIVFGPASAMTSLK